MNQKVAAIVVTYNRKKILIDCLKSLREQKYKLDAILIVDNNSNDGTSNLLIENGYLHNVSNFSSSENELYITTIKSLNNKEELIDIIYVHKYKNDGGAGGFYEGINRADKYDYVWIMDDDVITDRSALFELCEVLELEDYGFLCSRVLGTNNISMNVPSIDYRLGENKYPTWDNFIERNMIKVISATFVSILIPTKQIKKVGLPLKQMFIWGDDIEYTLRLSMERPCYLVGKSVVYHHRNIQRPINIEYEKNTDRIKMQFYAIRNSIYIERLYFNKLHLIKLIIRNITSLLKSVINLNLTASYIIMKGMFVGFFFNPKNHTDK